LRIAGEQRGRWGDGELDLPHGVGIRGKGEMGRQGKINLSFSLQLLPFPRH